MTFTNLRLFLEGTWANLYLAQVVETGQTVIIKALRPQGGPSERRMFLREMKIVRRNVHKHVLQALCYCDEDGQTYYVMPYFPQGALTPFAGKLNHDQLRAAARQICDGVAAMHAQELVHGDIKPDNVMVTADGNLKVGDPLGNGAGCTVMYNENSGGTPGYWAPEVAGGRGPMSKAGDVFSFGATLFHLATGIRPRDGMSFDPWTSNAHVPSCVRRIILAATRAAPHERPVMAQIVRAIDGDMASLDRKPNEVAVLLLAFGGLAVAALLTT